MKKSFVLGLLISFIFSTNTYSQDSLAYKTRFQIRVAGGVNILFSDLNENRETDFLIGHGSDISVPVSFTFTTFFNKHWGMEVDLKISNDTGNDKKFTESIIQQYEASFFSTVTTGITNSTPMTGTVGIVYRKETEKFYFHPKLAIGVTSFETSWGRANLKEKNTNIEYELLYSANKTVKDHFAVLLSHAMGYKISKRFWVDLETSLLMYKTNIVYERALLNLYTQDSQKEIINYKKNILEANISLGLKYVFY